LTCTGRTGDQLTGVSAVSPDQFFPAGSYVYEAENPGSGSGTGTVTEVDTGTGLSGGPITSSGTVSLATISNNRLLANISGSTAAPTANTLTALIDSAIDSTQGDVLYRGASAWSALGPGTAGQFLETGGAAANPSWASLPIATSSVLGVVKVGSGLAVTGGGVLSATGGTGTVTSVTLAGANGVGLTGTNPITTSGTITVGLGAITPSSVAASGTVTGSNLSGTNTGDQTITLTGDVTGSGTGTFATTIANSAINAVNIGNGVITYPKIQAMNPDTLLGNPTGSSVSPEEITLGAGLTFSGTTLVATGSGGTVTSITAGSGLSGGTITTSGTIALATIGSNSVLANITAGSAVPTSVAATALLDHAFGSAQGSVLYRSSAVWVTLGPGTSGQVLSSGGASANVLWTNPGTGTVTSVATGTGLTGGTITTTGTISLASITDGDLLANTSGGSAAPVPTTVSAYLDHVLSSSQGAILYRGASVWAALAPGTSGQLLSTGGGSGNPSWTSSGTGTVTTVNTGTGLTGGPISGSGTISLAAIASGNVLGNVSGISAAPVAITPSQILDSIDNTQGDVLYRSASGWSALTPGTAGQVLTTNGASANPSWTSSSLTAVANNTILANISGGSALPTADTLTAILDSVFTTNQGAIIFRGSGSWQSLNPGTTGQVLTANGGSSDLSWLTPAVGSVTSVSLTVPAWLTVSGSPVTSSGTLAVTAAGSQTQNEFLATPNGSSGAVGLRAIVAADLPSTGLNITSHYGTITADADASTITFNLATSDWHSVQLGGNRTLALSNATVGQQFTLVLQQAASGGPYSPTWFSGISWFGGTFSAPSTPTTASAYLVATFKCIAANTYLGFWLGNSAS
jgi:hypothetical protein